MDTDNNLVEKTETLDETIKQNEKPSEDATALLLRKFEDLEKKYLEATTPKPKPKRVMSEAQKENLRKARERKIELDKKKKEEKKKLKQEEKKIIKQRVIDAESTDDNVMVSVEEPKPEPTRPKTPEPVNMEIKEPDPEPVRSDPIPIPQPTSKNPFENYTIAKRRRR